MNKRVDLQDILTPDSKDLQPRRAFAALMARLQEEEQGHCRRKPKLLKFASLSEEAARRTAVELNFLMLSTQDTPSPLKVCAALNNEVRYLAGRLACALEDMPGVAAGALTGAHDLASPYEALPRGRAATCAGPSAPMEEEPEIKRRERRRRAFPRLGNQDSKHFNVAFGPELETLRKIDEREISQARDTGERDQIEQIDRYDRARHERDARAAILNPDLPWSERADPHGAIVRARYDEWKGPPARQVLLEPLIARLRALSALADTASRRFSSDQVGRGKRPSLASSAWEVEYAKICWRCIQDQFGDDVACGLISSAEGDFVQFIRLMAGYASGKWVESGFGDAAKKALAWGREMSAVEKRAREFNTPNVA
jgi:hypothetical protein